jgi:hypothetical protein
MNMKENQNAVVVAETYSIMPRNAQIQIDQALQMMELNTKLLKELLKEKVDYDRIPGTDKPTLLKPGAEMLCRVYGLTIGNQHVTDKTEDWERGIFSYAVTCPLVHIESGKTIAVGIGAANSQEVKYRYITAKDENGKKIYKDGKPVKIENPDGADNVNTLIKMASKRAFVDAVLKATCASRLFTQDVEDMKAFNSAQRASETASTAQVNLIRKLSDGDLNKVKALLNANVPSFEAILRSDASRLIDALKAQQDGEANGGYNYGPPPASQDSEYAEAYSSQNPEQAYSASSLACADCGAVITKAEDGYSRSKYGRPLCRDCQTAAKQA